MENKNTQKLRVYRGLPASGKSTEAKKWVEEDPDFRIRIDKDEIRRQLYGKSWGFSQMQSDMIDATELAMVETAVKAGMSVAIASQNLEAGRMSQWYKVGLQYGIEVEVENLEHHVDTLLSRNCTRLYQVPDHVIREGYKKYTKKGGKLIKPPKKPSTALLEAEPYVADDSLPGAYIFDVDGTLALMNRNNPDCRSPYDYHRVSEDEVIVNVVRVAKILSEKYPIIVMSGREDVCRQDTADWLQRAGVEVKELFMRAAGTQEPDDLIKLRLFDEHVRNNYNVLGVFDDRLKVCRMWEQIGLTLFRVGPIDADF